MGFNYGRERVKMEKEFEEMAAACRAAGMTEDQLEGLHRFMLDQLNSDRRFYTHTQFYDGLKFSDGDDADEGRSPLLEKFLEQFSTTQVEIWQWTRMDWLEDIDTPELAKWLKVQSEQEIEFLTLLIVDELKQAEIAQIWNCSSAKVSKRRKYLKEKIAEILPEKLKRLCDI